MTENVGIRTEYVIETYRLFLVFIDHTENNGWN